MNGMQRLSAVAFCTAAICASAHGAGFNSLAGETAPPLIASEWIGAPVSLGAVRGNTVVLAFWNADIPC